jgi:hypothetical protein
MYSYSPQYQEPIWVSARELAREPDHVAWEKLAERDRDSVQKSIETQKRYMKEMESKGKALAIPSALTSKIDEDLCLGRVLSTPPYSGSAAPPDFAGLAREAEGIVEARITAIQPGFFLGVPASLLEVQVTKTYRPLPAHTQTNTYYVYHPFARFAVGGFSFCNVRSARPVGDKKARSTVFEPEVGGRVLLFVFGTPLDRDGILIAPLEDQILYESPKGELALSAALKRGDELHPVRSLDEVEALLEVALQRRPIPKKPARPGDKTPPLTEER